MKTPDLPLRESLVAAFAPVALNSIIIPTYEEYKQPTTDKPIAIIPYGALTFEAYIILLNQTSNNISPKCGRQDECSIQVQITTVFPFNTGGSKYAEMIGNKLTEILFKVDGSFNALPIDPEFKIWKGVLEGARNIPYKTDTNSIWVRQLMLTYSISQ